MFHEFLMDTLLIYQTKYQDLYSTQKVPSLVLGVLEATRVINHGSELKYGKWQTHFAYTFEWFCVHCLRTNSGYV